MDNSIKSKARTMPVIPLKNTCILPDSIAHFDLNRPKSIASVERAMSMDQVLFLTAQKRGDVAKPGFNDLYEIGTYARIKQIIKMPNKIVRVLAEGICRSRLISLEDNECYLGVVEIIEDDHTGSEISENHAEAMRRQLLDMHQQYSALVRKNDQGLLKHLSEQEDLSKLMDQMTVNLPVPFEKKQAVLERVNLKLRFDYLIELFQKEIEVMSIRKDISDKVKERVEKNQREYVLREQLRYIREELGDESSVSDADAFKEKLEKIKASKEVKAKIKKEISRFERMGNNSSESSVQRSYIETLLEMPWDKKSKDNKDLKKAEKILKEDHYGLEKVKERIVEYLAVRQLKDKGGSPTIICLAGPPGTGKTSIAKSMARAMDKKYVRISLGGVRDEAEIRGHRRTYIGAMPGRLVTAIKQAGVKNPLILLDEIDKMGRDYRGDISSAMLEVLDSEQNVHFRDHYLELPLDLSEVTFVATANDLSHVDQPLLDRMEVIEISGYTSSEKLHIAKEHLVSKQLKANGIPKKALQFTDKGLEKIILSYTKEAGVRELERMLGKICRKTARGLVEDKNSVVRITGRNVGDYLGKEKYRKEKAAKKADVGIVRGLAWTSVGGVTLEIEVNDMPGKGELKLTGQLGDVMKESAMTALSFVRSIAPKYKVADDYFSTHDLHIHIPEGAVPKDGPSAGVTMATAILSCVARIPVRADVAMTGEVTLRGRVLPIGGLKEKMLAAKLAGITTVLVPEENKADVSEIDEEIREGLTIVRVSKMAEVLENALVQDDSKNTDRK
ncbi:MAG: endopeptidase La [Lachnospiraceae bacterium]|nr:endopeptidase La [Lachnospiraceae bacterium]